jgi:predicted Fe-Mo cluster-binding NifX family protein
MSSQRSVSKPRRSVSLRRCSAEKSLVPLTVGASTVRAMCSKGSHSGARRPTVFVICGWCGLVNELPVAMVDGHADPLHGATARRRKGAPHLAVCERASPASEPPKCKPERCSGRKSLRNSLRTIAVASDDPSGPDSHVSGPFERSAYFTIVTLFGTHPAAYAVVRNPNHDGRKLRDIAPLLREFQVDLAAAGKVSEACLPDGVEVVIGASGTVAETIEEIQNGSLPPVRQGRRQARSEVTKSA